MVDEERTVVVAFLVVAKVVEDQLIAKRQRATDEHVRPNHVAGPAEVAAGPWLVSSGLQQLLDGEALERSHDEPCVA